MSNYFPRPSQLSVELIKKFRYFRRSSTRGQLWECRAQPSWLTITQYTPGMRLLHSNCPWHILEYYNAKPFPIWSQDFLIFRSSRAPSNCVYGTLPRPLPGPQHLHQHQHQQHHHLQCYSFQEDLTRQRSVANLGEWRNIFVWVWKYFLISRC